MESMAPEKSHEPARDPLDLERFLVARQRTGDVDGMVALYEDDAILDSADGRIWRGKAEIRALFVEIVASGRKFGLGEQLPALIASDLALTATRTGKGEITVEVARRQSDGTWLWVIDKFTHA
jgi:ketosteroid isomerase-like protein